MLKNFLRIAALVLPLAVLGGIAIKGHINHNTGQIWEISIKGYDPRDLLFGHYLTFRYDWNPPQLTNGFLSSKQCVCLQKNGDDFKAPKATTFSCNAETYPKCDAVVSNIERNGKYFIPEKNANNLNYLLSGGKRELYAKLRVRDDGGYSLIGITVDGQDLIDYLKTLENKNK